MKIHSRTSAFAALCKATGKWGVFADHEGALERANYDVGELMKAYGGVLSIEMGGDAMQAIADGQVVFLCDSEEDHNRIYESIVGDDGPTDLNDYNGPVRVYALTCDPKGQLRNENT